MIRLSNIQRIFQVGDQQVHALRDIELHIQPGEHLSIMGPSGSGKSSLLNIIGLLDRPSSGRYELGGTDVTDLSDDQQARTRRDKIGFVFQDFHLVPRLTAAENVELPMILAGVETSERKRRVTEILASLELDSRGHHRPEQLSGGQRQRVAIARATIMRPSVLLADEPTGNLDRKSGQAITQVLETLNQNGITLIIVTHDSELGRRAKRQLRMVDGRIVADIDRDKPS